MFTTGIARLVPNMRKKARRREETGAGLNGITYAEMNIEIPIPPQIDGGFAIDICHNSSFEDVSWRFSTGNVRPELRTVARVLFFGKQKDMIIVRETISLFSPTSELNTAPMPTSSIKLHIPAGSFDIHQGPQVTEDVYEIILTMHDASLQSLSKTFKQLSNGPEKELLQMSKDLPKNAHFIRLRFFKMSRHRVLQPQLGRIRAVFANVPRSIQEATAEETWGSGAIAVVESSSSQQDLGDTVKTSEDLGLKEANGLSANTGVQVRKLRAVIKAKEAGEGKVGGWDSSDDCWNS